MVFFFSSFWVFVTTCVLYLFRFITKYLFRFQVGYNSQKVTPTGPAVVPQDDNPIALKPKAEPDVIEFEDSEYDGFGEKETPQFSFTFQFQTFDDGGRSNGESSLDVSPKKEESMSNANKYEFLSSKDFSGFVEEPQVVSFTVEELYMNSSKATLDSKEIVDDGLLSVKDMAEHNSENETIHADTLDDSCSVEESEKPESIVLDELLLSEKVQLVNFEQNSPSKEDFSDEILLLSEKEFPGFDSDLESESFGDRFSTMNNVMDSSSEAFTSDKDFDSEVEPENIMEHDEGKTESVGAFQSSEEIHVERVAELENPIESVKENTEPVGGFQNSEEIQAESVAEPENTIEPVEGNTEPVGGFQNSEEVHVENEAEPKNAMDSVEEKMESVGGSEETHVENPRTLEPGDVGTTDPISPVDKLMGLYEEMFESMDDIETYLEPHFQKPSDFKTEAQLEREYAEMKAECEREDSGVEGDGLNHNSMKTEEPSAESSTYLDSEDYDQLETLWEHQNLIEQLKMELKKVKATGLPTILEESESPRMSEDLKPWKFDEKFLHEDRMDELHKFYKSYIERMRKFDIVNYQKMYAMGFLQLKDPLQSISSRKSSTPTLTSILSQSFRLSKRQKPEEDSTEKFARELQSDLEVVYVGQVCLSWEFLHWEYGKARELLESDPYETRQYNQVAGELQQFQVLMQRFLENEPFQGPRVQNYIKSRCILRNLLQVPVIKEDPKDKEGRKTRKDAITCSMVLEIIEETVRIFWDFIRADKDESNVIMKGFLGPQVELSDPADSELLVDVQTNLQKKEKKIKDIVRSGNCIVRRFKKHHEEGRPDQLVFFSQIDLKLVSRVLKMSRITTDQLIWCQKKLSKINIVHRKVHVEPSFLLFPC